MNTSNSEFQSSPRSMLLGDWRSGKQPTYSELEATLHAAGFTDVRRGPECGPFHTAVIGTKRCD